MIDPRLHPINSPAAAGASRDADHRRAAATPAAGSESVVVRVLRDADATGLLRLAGRDSDSAPRGRVLGAELGGVLVAAISLDDGRIVADPFRPSAGAVDMLRLRARQLGRNAASSGSGRLRRVINGLSRGHAYAGLAGSPPGAGGRLLKL